jgi:hypothetical protein
MPTDQVTADQGGEERLYLGTVTLSRWKSDPAGGITTTHTACSGLRMASNSAEAKGLFLDMAMDSKPGFSVDEVMCVRVADDLIEQAASALKAAQEPTNA